MKIKFIPYTVTSEQRVMKNDRSDIVDHPYSAKSAIEGSTAHSSPANIQCFIFLLICIEIVILIFYRLFFSIAIFDDSSTTNAFTSYNVTYYPMYQDVNVMMLIGFGFLMTFLKVGSWSAVAFTFLINALVVQLYFLWSTFWAKVLHVGWDASSEVTIREQNFTGASYSVASVLIAFGAVIGRVGPYQLLVMALIQIIGYTLNEYIVYELIKIYDVGGSTVIHTFGAYFGLAVSLIVGIKKKPGHTAPASASKISNTFAVIGTFFLWMFWPSFNAGFFPSTPQQRSLIILNTIISLTGSCLGTFATSALVREKFEMEHILNATLAGGVAIGASAGIFINPAASLTAGLLSGIISTTGFEYLTPYLKANIKLFDTCGVHNLHGIPGILGGILSSIAIAVFQSVSVDSNLAANLGFYNSTFENRDFSTQAWYQLLGLISSLGISIVFGLITGGVLYFGYDFRNHHFYRDTAFFETPDEEELKFQVGGSMINIGRD